MFTYLLTLSTMFTYLLTLSTMFTYLLTLSTMFTYLLTLSTMFTYLPHPHVPPTTAITVYAIGLGKLSANGQFFLGAEIVVSI